jgi:hypothetical protein
MVLPCAHRGECSEFAGVGQASLLQGADDLRLGTAQEGIGFLFQCDCGRQGDLVRGTQLLRGGGTLFHCGVARFAGQRKAQVRGGVFVRAIHTGGVGELR